MALAPFVDVAAVHEAAMSEEDWQRMCLTDRLRNPGKYRVFLGENVDAVIAHLRAWLDERGVDHD